MTNENQQEGLDWQVTTWNQMADLYAAENAPRIAPVANRVITHAALRTGEQVLDVGTGTGIIPELAAPIVGKTGHVTGIDISSEMLSFAQKQLADRGFTNVTLLEGGAESIPAGDNSFDVVLASLSFMYVVGAGSADLRKIHSGSAGCRCWPWLPGRPYPVPQTTSRCGHRGKCRDRDTRFRLRRLCPCRDVFAGVTTANLLPERQQEAREATFSSMWPDGDGPRHFRNGTQFIIGRKAG